MTEEQLIILTETKTRAESNTKRLNAHDEKLREMDRNYQVLLTMSDNMKVIAEQTKTTAESVYMLQGEVTKLRDTEIARKAVEEDRNLRKNEFRNAFSGKLLYRCLEYAIIGVLSFIAVSVVFYLKSQVGM